MKWFSGKLAHFVSLYREHTHRLAMFGMVSVNEVNLLEPVVNLG